MSDITGRRARRQAELAQREQRKLISEQRSAEQAELREQQNEIARRRFAALNPRIGRRSLIRTSETGVPRGVTRVTLG